MATASTASFHIDVRADALGVVLCIAGDVDVAAVPFLRTCVDGVIEATTGQVVVDLTDVTFVDSSGASALLEARHRLISDSRSLPVARASPAAARFLASSGLCDMFGGVTG